MNKLKAFLQTTPLSIPILLAVLVVPCFFADAFGAHWAFGIPIGISLDIVLIFLPSEQQD